MELLNKISTNFFSCCLTLHVPHGAFIFKNQNQLVYVVLFPYANSIMYENWTLTQMSYRNDVVHSYSEKKDVQVSVWSVCMDAHDSYSGLYAVLIHCCKYFRRNILVSRYQFGFCAGYAVELQTLDVP